MMFQRAGQFIVLIFIHFSATSAQSDFTVLRSLKDVWKNTPPNWEGSDPCGGGWDGVNCTDSRVTSIILSSMRLTGELPDDIQLLTELQILYVIGSTYNPGLTGPLSPQIGNLTKLTTLILIGCGFNGSIPGTIGSMTKLTFLALNSNSFTGAIPPSIGNLINLYWLDLADNKLSGTIPVSSAIEPGLDLLVNTKHFHFGENQLRGEIPAKLFNANMTLKHLLFENNWLTGRVPSTIGLVDSLEVIRLDKNLLTGEVPSSFNDLNHVNELFLSNNNLSGSFPDLTGMSSLVYLDMNKTGLQGQLPPEFFSLPQLQTVVVANNLLNGTLDFGSTYSTQLQLVDMQSNRITDFLENGYTSDLILVGNPICTTVSGVRKRYCSLPTRSDASDSSAQDSCPHTLCISPNKVLSPTCKCAYPYTGSLNFRALPFSDLGNSSIYTSLKSSLMDFTRYLNLPVDSVSLSVLTKIDNAYPFLTLNFFPSGQDRFTYTGVAVIAHMLSNNAYKPPDDFGPYVFKGDSYDYFADHSIGQKSSSHSGIIIGSVVGGCVLVLLLVIAGIYAYRQKGRAERADKRNSPFALWDSNKGSGDVPQLKGPRSFSFEQLKKYTNGFSEANSIGAGGYGRVYKGTLPRGNLVAIKRAQQGSTQGCHEFKTEIELLSRVHHKNLVRLVGFCFDEGEQMLVYEYISNGTLKDNISGRTGIRLDWMRRLRITLGAARGLQYLHDLADPPIIHRDIKSNNILLDERLNAKVADFGLSKPMGDSDKTHLTTQVKGTLGYMDPEYYMTQQVTEKSDVYSFGVVMLEMITARSPIERGKFIVREVKLAMDKTKVLYNLQEIIDPIIGVSMQLKGLEKYVDVALKCVEETGSQRPSMSEVVKEIENIMESAGFNPNAESCATSASYSDGGMGFEHPYNSNENLIAHSRSVY